MTSQSQCLMRKRCPWKIRSMFKSSILTLRVKALGWISTLSEWWEFQLSSQFTIKTKMETQSTLAKIGSWRDQKSLLKMKIWSWPHTKESTLTILLIKLETTNQQKSTNLSSSKLTERKCKDSVWRTFLWSAASIALVASNWREKKLNSQGRTPSL